MAILTATYPSKPMRNIGVRTFFDTKRNADYMYHSQPGGCNYSLNTMLGLGMNPKIWEQEVYEDAEGQHWYAVKGLAYDGGVDGWRKVDPCGQCENDYIDDLLGVAPWLDMTTEPECNGRWEEADFMSNDWQHDENVRAALAMCEVCPIKVECRDWARTVAERYDLLGTYGGETHTQRRKHLANLNA